MILDFDKKQKSIKHKRHHQDSHHAGRPSTSTSGHRHHGHHKTKQPKLEEPDTFKPSGSYRDRAKERREGLNKDFELDPDDLKISNPIVGGGQLEDGEKDQTDQLDEAERRRQQIEESKYLGGDVEHTHLVKGLDFALLEKVRNDQKLAEKLANDHHEHNQDLSFADNSDSDEEQFKKEALIAASATTSSKKQLLDIEKIRKGKSTELVNCQTALARRILNVLDEKWPAKSELFLPGRMSYLIPMDEEAEDQSVTTYLLSKEDSAKQDDNEAVTESDLGLEQLINILAKIRQGKANATSESISKKMRDLEKDSNLNDYY